MQWEIWGSRQWERCYSSTVAQQGSCVIFEYKDLPRQLGLSSCISALIAPGFLLKGDQDRKRAAAGLSLQWRASQWLQTPPKLHSSGNLPYSYKHFYVGTRTFPCTLWPCLVLRPTISSPQNCWTTSGGSFGFFHTTFSMCCSMHECSGVHATRCGCCWGCNLKEVA